MKYLTLIRAIALLHQHQREIQRVQHNGRTVQYIEVSTVDIWLANRLAHEVLGRSLDELPPQTRKLLRLLVEMVKETCRQKMLTQKDYLFSRRTVREQTGWGNTQLKIHMQRLVDMEYLLLHPRAKGQGYVYELVYDGDGDSRPFMSGLIDIENECNYDEQWSGLKGRWSGEKVERSGVGRPLVGAWSVGGRGAENAQSACPADAELILRVKTAKKALKGDRDKSESYVPVSSYLHTSFNKIAAKEKIAAYEQSQISLKQPVQSDESKTLTKSLSLVAIAAKESAV